jgi:hypothetical protein
VLLSGHVTGKDQLRHNRLPMAGRNDDLPGDSATRGRDLRHGEMRHRCQGAGHHPPVTFRRYRRHVGLLLELLRPALASVPGRHHAQRHQVADDTGDWRQILTDYPGWRIFCSDLGRLYATRPGVTVYAWLTAQLSAEIHAWVAPQPPDSRRLTRRP